MNPQCAIASWMDDWGHYEADPALNSLLIPALRLIRYDDAWRPLAESAIQDCQVTDLQMNWLDHYGGTLAAGRPPEITFPHYWPASFDLWPYAGDLRSINPMSFRGELLTRPVSSPFAEGIVFTIRISDLRDRQEAYPQQLIRMPVGIELPLSAQARVYGIAEMYTECRQLDYSLTDPALPHGWYYLEAELFGGYVATPGISETIDPGRLADPVHAGAPFVAASDDGHLWWGIAGEADYGAATLIGRDRLRHFSTLFLAPGGVEEWSFVLWRQRTDAPQQLLLAATRDDGFFNALNPLGFIPQGAPEGPIVFANVSRIPFQMHELQALRPGLVLLNYHYDHIASTANLYGEWRTYEGFSYSESQLRKLIGELKGLGARVGYYGTHATQAESHRVVQQDDYVLDAWGRRIHDWEPGNWVADPGNADAAERYARAEAEFAQHYQLDAVFVDRLDYMGVNANPARQGRGTRLAQTPSLRLGIIELNRERMRWQRRLNPHLLVGLNNTTQWVGVRYSDFTLLEGGDDLHDYALPWLTQPHGLVNKRHFPVIFGEYAGGNLFQIIGKAESAHGFLNTLRLFIRRSLVSGVIAQPYGDEIFVDRDSIFYQPGRDKMQSDEEKNSILSAIPYAGGAEWRMYWEAVAPALHAAQRLTIPIANVLSTPEEGQLPPAHRFLARQGDGGGWYVGLMNEDSNSQHYDFTLDGHRFNGVIPPHTAQVWWREPEGSWQTLQF